MKEQRYYVYVIELDDAAGQRTRPDLPVVYVGQSSRMPEERFRQHLAGHKASRWVRKHGLRLRPRLYRSHNPLPTQAAALAMEKELARRLRKRGYVVRGGH
jgi:GIY-YIG catalytic domain